MSGTPKGQPVGPRSLAEVEAMYGSLVETMPAIVYVAEPHPPYKTIYVSPSISTLGYTHEEWLSDAEQWVKVLHPDDRDWVLEQTARVLKEGGRNDRAFVNRCVNER